MKEHPRLERRYIWRFVEKIIGIKKRAIRDAMINAGLDPKKIKHIIKWVKARHRVDVIDEVYEALGKLRDKLKQ